MQGTASLTHWALGFMPLALGTPRAPFGNEKAENTAWLNQKDFSWLGAVDAVRRGEGDVCRNKVDYGHDQEQKNKGGQDSSGIRRPKLRKVHTVLRVPVPSQLPCPHPP